MCGNYILAKEYVCVILGMLLIALGMAFFCILMLFGLQTGRPKTAAVGVLMGVASFGLAVFFLQAGVNLSLTR
jgi:hypothetical protein